MTRLEKCEYCVDKGYTYNEETGIIYNINGKQISAKKDGYIYIKVNVGEVRHNLLGHQFAWYYTNNEVVDCIDHINMDRGDNRICNLRSVSLDENKRNNSRKGYTYYKKNNTWISRISLNKQTIYLGSFNSEDEARNAYLKAKKIHHKI